MTSLGTLWPPKRKLLNVGAKMSKVLCYLLILFLAKCYCFRVPSGVFNIRPRTQLFGARGWQTGVPKFVRVYRKIEGKVEDDPLYPRVEHIAKTADLRKAVSVKAFRVTHMTEIADFIMLIEGANNRQISAIASSIEEDMEAEFNVKPFGKDGTAVSGWFVLDYGSIIAHVMTPAMSNFYKLEKKWLDGETVDLSHIIAPRSPQETAAAGGHSTLVEGRMDDWGFSNGEDGGEGDIEGGETDPFSFDSSVQSYSPSHSPGHDGHTPGAHEVPAEDVAFWGEDLAEQLYLEDQQAQAAASKSAAVGSAEAPAEPEKAAASKRKGVRKPNTKGADAPSSAESIAPKTRKGTLSKLMSLLGKGPAKKPQHGDDA